MRKSLLIMLLLSLSQFAYSDESVCPEPKNPSWERMDEKNFHPEQVKKELKLLTDYFDGKLEVAPEFIEQQKDIIDGGFLYFEMIKLKEKNSEYYPMVKNKFCEFMEKRAYIVH